ncbi:hypothetical protein ACOMHN_061953 [Nucella lapillus]
MSTNVASEKNIESGGQPSEAKAAAEITDSQGPPKYSGEVCHSPDSVETFVPVDNEYDLRNCSPDSAGDPVPTPILSSVRIRLTLVSWFCMAMVYSQRTNLSIAMVCMVKSITKNETHESFNSKCPEPEESDNPQGFDWDKALQGQILGSFFYGYLILQIPGGILSERFGAKVVIAMGMVPVAVLSLLTPVLTKIHYIVLIVLRVVLGLGESTPAEFKNLSKAERIYLERTVPTVSAEDSKGGIPWKSIFTSGPVWAIIAAHTFGNYTYYMNMTQMPTYMKEVLKFNIESNGAFSMLPYLVFWLSVMGAGVLSDVIISHNVPMIVVRKSFAFIGLIGPAAFMVVTGYMDCTLKYVAVFTLCCAVGLTGFGFASYLVNHGDLAPDYAGTLFGISNTMSTLPGFVAPIIVGALTPDGTDIQWRRTFFVAAGINALGAVIYLVFGSASIQPWSSAKVASVRPKMTASKEKMEKIKDIYTSVGKRESEHQRQSTIHRVSTIAI